MIRVAFVVGDYPPAEKKLREDTAKSYSSAEVEVGIISVAPQPFGGLGPGRNPAGRALLPRRVHPRGAGRL